MAQKDGFAIPFSVCNCRDISLVCNDIYRCLVRAQPDMTTCSYSEVQFSRHESSVQSVLQGLCRFEAISIAL